MTAGAAESGPVAIVGGTVIDGTGGGPLKDGVIVVDGPRIVAVGPASTEIPADARVIPADGTYVIPGLVTPGTFLVDGAWPALTVQFEGRYDQVAIEAAQLALKGGVTTIFDGWGPREPLVRARDAINAGRVTAARIFLCGNWIGLGGPFSKDMRPQFRQSVGEPFARRINALWEDNVGEQLTSMPAELVRAEVRRYAESGIDYLTYPANVHLPDAPTTTAHYLFFSPRVQRVIVEEAHRAGIRAQAVYATTDESINLALDAGVDVLAPIPWGGRPMHPDIVRRIASTGTSVIYEAPPDEDLEWYRSHPEAEWIYQVERVRDLDSRAMIDAGVNICTGVAAAALSPDQRAAWSPGGAPGLHATIGDGHIRSLRALQERGMSPLAALRAVTGNAARAYGVDRDLGTLEPGRFADLVVLDADPLASVDNYRAVRLVMKEGSVVDLDAMPTRRLHTAEPGHAG